MNIDKIISRAKQIVSTQLSDDELKEIINDGFLVATRGLMPTDIRDIYIDDMLGYYLLSQINLINGDFALYNNYSSLFNNALTEFRMIASEVAPVYPDELQYKNLLY